jgi:hypothetical protein
MSIAGQAGSTDASGNINVNEATLLSGEDTQAVRLWGGLGMDYTQINTNATTVVKATPGAFAGIYVQTAGNTSTVSVYDNTAASGPQLIPTTSVTTTVGTLITPLSGGCVKTKTGLTVVTAGTGAATINVYWA